MRRPAAWVAVGALGLAIAVALAVVLTHQRAGYSNEIPNFGAHAFLPPGQAVCNDGEPIPRNARALRVYTGTDDQAAGPLELEIRQSGRLALSGRTEKPFKTGPVTIALGSTNPALPGARVCLFNRGPVPISFGGAPTGTDRGTLSRPPVGAPAVVAGVRQPGRLRIEYPGGGRRAISEAGAVARRAGLVKAGFFGSWTLWAALTTTVLATALALVAVLRVDGR